MKVPYVGEHMNTNVAKFLEEICFYVVVLWFSLTVLSNTLVIKLFLSNLVANPWILSNEGGDMHGFFSLRLI